jgi:hypothetical protein
MKTLSIPLAVALLCALSACAEVQEASVSNTLAAPAPDLSSPIDEDGTTLRLEQVMDPEGRLLVDLSYHPSEGAVPPRMVEIWLGMGSGLAFESGSPGGAVTSSGKLFVAREEETGIRVVILSTSDLTPLPSGSLGRLVFRRDGPGSASVSILERMPIFAPQPANLGLSLPPMLQLDLGGAP